MLLAPLGTGGSDSVSWSPVLLLISLYLLLVIVMPLSVSAAVSVRALHRGRCCPMCRNETLPVVPRWLGWAARLLRGASLQRRWCPACGWEAMTRLSAAGAHGRNGSPNPRRLARRRPFRVDEPALDPALAAATRGALRLRELRVDGRPWRVLLRCAAENGRWYGRLLFVGPSGALWKDELVPLSGRSPDDVLTQALALSDQSLAHRLSDLISD